jgi:glycosyltransferase involved in cell wall biosynthesis
VRIAVLTTVNPYFANGAAANRWTDLLTGLLDCGVEIHLVLWQGYQSKEEKRKYRETTQNSRYKVSYLSPLVIDNLFLRRLDHYIIQKIISPWLRFRTRRILKKEQIEILWSDHELDMYQFAVDWKKRSSKTILFTELSEYLDIHRYNVVNRFQFKLGEKRATYFIKYFLPSLNGIAYMTNTLLTYYQSVPNKPISAIHLPMTVDFERFKQPCTQSLFSSPYIAYVGVMNKHKDGVDVLIKAFAEITDDFPDYTLQLFGFYHYDIPELMQLIKDLGLEMRIQYHGEKCRTEIVGIIKCASLLVLPRPDSYQAKGGFPTKLGEYLASGTPLCCTRVGEIPLYLEDGVSVYFAEPGSPQSFADAMKRALSDPEEARHIAEKGRQVAIQNFNKVDQANKLYNFLVEIQHVEK